ncbi:unnamed protein product [Kluyveromyces dobzhanskii CBS 2104]|uniref:Protein BCP1 n=1 Tax=Kluyveromyces dobzhanskii CBS 2104 TaxID=1427455 RepID=A0A0A8LA49_9SACH|nr:unnamed protein product [Kluyveromyces dobzhanskii CBS 2104]
MVQVVKLKELSKKRAVDEESDIDISSTDSENADEGDLGKDEQEVVNIDFDFFNGNPDVDFHALKNLMRQLFGPQESNRIQLSALADLILESPITTIKTDGKESDPYCFLSFIDYKANKDSDYAKYLRKVDTKLATFLQTIDQSNKTCALVMSERLINMPPEVVPPLYNITLEDVKVALGDDQTYDFYLIASRKYEVNFDMDEDDLTSNKAIRKKVRQTNEIDYFHEEDRFFEKAAKVHVDTASRKGLIVTFMVLDHAGLVKSIEDLDTAIKTW